MTALDISFLVDNVDALGILRRLGRRRESCVSRVEGGGGRGDNLPNIGDFTNFWGIEEESDSAVLIYRARR